MKIPGCKIILGDRPWSITRERILNLLSPWQKIKMFCSALWNSLFGTSVLNEWRRWPDAKRVLIDERNLYLTAMLEATERQLQKCSTKRHPSGFVAPVIVAVVGMSQQKGIYDLLQERESPLRRVAKRIKFEQLQKIPAFTPNRLFGDGLTILIHCLKFFFVRWIVYYIAGIDFIDMSNHEADSLATSDPVSTLSTLGEVAILGIVGVIPYVL